VRLAPPLRFAVHPRALRVRVPLRAPGLSPAARQLRARSALGSLGARLPGPHPRG
jgi:hypothetical protein